MKWRLPSGPDTGVIALILVAAAVTLGVFGMQVDLRADAAGPTVPTIFRRLFLSEDYPATPLLLFVFVLALAPPVQRVATALAAVIGARPLLACAMAMPVLAIGSLLVYHAHPLSMDEYVPYLQSQAFAGGRLTGRFRPELVDWLVYRDFQGHFLHVSRTTGDIASAYWPGFALLLTPFTALGVPWLCNPVLGTGALWVVHRLTLDLTGDARTAGAAMLMTLGSAAFTVHAISFYSMTAHLLCNALFALLLLRPTTARCVAAGLVGGLALNLHNPVPHIFFAAPWIAWMVWRRQWRLLGALAVGYLPWAVLGFAWHQMLLGLAAGKAVAGSTGGSDPLSEALRIFAGIFRAPLPNETLDSVIELAKLWLWSAPGLVILAALGFRSRWTEARVRLLAASALTTVVGYFFIPLPQGHGWSFRYFHSSWFVLPVLGAMVLGRRGVSDIGPRGAIGRYGLGLALLGLLAMTPLFAWQVYRFIGGHLDQLPRSDHGRPHVVIINPKAGYYAQDLVQNDAFLRGPLIRFVSRGADEDALMMSRAFPNLSLLSTSGRGTVWGVAVPEIGALPRSGSN